MKTLYKLRNQMKTTHNILIIKTKAIAHMNILIYIAEHIVMKTDLLMMPMETKHEMFGISTLEYRVQRNIYKKH